ncbi:MAG: hypothetical protein HQK54_12605 [Oligoflexales bacterium]|nr:hypothetical protein [Oligoflexales bacterium]
MSENKEHSKEHHKEHDLHKEHHNTEHEHHKEHNKEPNKEQHKSEPVHEKKDNKKKKVVAEHKQEKKTPWTEKRCLKAAHRFSSVEEWEKGFPSSYKAACSHGWLEICTAHMKKESSRVVGKIEPKRTAKEPSRKHAA